MKNFLILIYALCATDVVYADTETINWYVDDTLYQTTTCESGGNINLPTQPAKYGYTFLGWAPAYDLSTLNTNPNGDAYYAITNTGDCRYRTIDMSSAPVISCTNSNFTNLSAGSWKTEFSYGTVYGDSKCSITSGSSGASRNLTDTYGKNCWCRATGFVPISEDIMYTPAVSLWVFAYAYDSYTSIEACASLCASSCGLHSMIEYSDFRSALYGSN